MFRDGIERRIKPRVNGPIPVKVCCTPTSGESFEIIGTVLDNLSTSGLHVCVEHPVAVASPLVAFISFAGTEIMASGIVRRVEMQHDGSFGLGVAFESYRLVSDQ